jgi:hypothetical protein
MAISNLDRLTCKVYGTQPATISLSKSREVPSEPLPSGLQDGWPGAGNRVAFLSFDLRERGFLPGPWKGRGEPRLRKKEKATHKNWVF